VSARIVHVGRETVVAAPIGTLVATRDKELRPEQTVGDADPLLTREAVQVIPVVDDGGRYVGAVDRGMLAAASLATPAGAIASDIVPTARSSEAALEAIARLDATGGSRLVVVEDDGA